MFKSIVCWFLLTAAAGFADAADRGEIEAADGRAVRATVEAQLKALAAGDSEKAFSYATPAIRAQFENNAGAFLDMVRRGYPMLVKPAAISFFRPESIDGMVTQSVQFRDPEGNLWRAIYELQRQPDKTWRINGCAVVPDNGATTT